MYLEKIGTLYGPLTFLYMLLTGLLFLYTYIPLSHVYSPFGTPREAEYCDDPWADCCPEPSCVFGVCGLLPVEYEVS